MINILKFIIGVMTSYLFLKFFENIEYLKKSKILRVLFCILIYLIVTHLLEFIVSWVSIIIV